VKFCAIFGASMLDLAALPSAPRRSKGGRQLLRRGETQRNVLLYWGDLAYLILPKISENWRYTK